MTDTKAWRRLPHDLRVHPAAEVWPMLTDGDLDALGTSILDVGLLHPPVIWRDPEGVYWLLDGRNRLEACRRVEVEPVCWVYEGGDPELYVLAANEHRRHATASQRAMAVALTANAIGGGDRDGDSAEMRSRKDEVTSADAAMRGAVSVRLVEACRYFAHRYDDLRDAVLAGTIKATAAEAEARRRDGEEERAERQFAARIAAAPDAEDVKRDYPDLAEKLADEGSDAADIGAEYKSRVAQDCRAVARVEQAATDLLHAVSLLTPHSIDVAQRHGTTVDTRHWRRVIGGAHHISGKDNDHA